MISIKTKKTEQNKTKTYIHTQFVYRCLQQQYPNRQRKETLKCTSADEWVTCCGMSILWPVIH